MRANVVCIAAMSIGLAACEGSVATELGDASARDAAWLDAGGAPFDSAAGLTPDGAELPGRDASAAADGGGAGILDASRPSDGGPASRSDGGATAVDASHSAADAGAVPAGCSALGLELIAVVNEYRIANDLPAIPASSSLCTVAGAHTRDLEMNRPHDSPGCNLHSWSDRGSWSACCYTADHAEAQCMWDKPRELTVYTGDGYEIVYSGSSSPEAALDWWRGSPAHHDVILSRGIWASTPWRAVGADVYSGYSVVWFGHATDPAP
jgi:hypothetical protein